MPEIREKRHMPAIAKSSLVNLSSLQGYFIIPSYQRAYRWGRKQVEDLLNDLHVFISGDNKTFFLQPLVLSRKEGNSYELIDGQQRLTTLCLLEATLCHFLGRDKGGLNFKITYASRPELESFFNSLLSFSSPDAERASSSLDFYCLFQARQIIMDWLTDRKEREFLSAFHEKLLNHVKFLWHDSTPESDSSPVQKYIRLNTGTIPLADGELCRALFLMPENHDFSDDFPLDRNAAGEAAQESFLSHLRFQRRLILAHDWDQIERTLWDASFWHFIGGGAYKDSVRIGLVLELHNDVQAAFAGEHVCFNKYSDEFKHIAKNRDAGQAWNELLKTMERLRYWYLDNDYYHWIGYLTLMYGYGKLSFLLKMARVLTEDEFRSILKDEIRKSIVPEGAPPLDELSFQNNYALCKNILLLFNIEYSRRHQGHSPRFPFPAFSMENNTIEHVYARNVESLKECEDRIQWIEEHRNFIRELDYGQISAMNREFMGKTLSLEEFTRQKEEILEKAEIFIARSRNGEKFPEELMAEEFNNLSAALSKFIEHHEDDDVHSLYNLALLDHDLNSYFKNSIFAIKQKKLRQRLLEGSDFIPAGTIALFLRHFARQRREAPWWTLEDQADYRLVLRDVLSEFWPELGKKENPAAEAEHGEA